MDVSGELLLMLDHLEGITSAVKSDHILNLFQDVDGVLPGDKERITRPIRAFLAMVPDAQIRFQIGRRIGVFSSLADMDNEHLTARVEKTRKQYGVTLDNLDEFIRTLMKRFI